MNTRRCRTAIFFILAGVLIAALTPVAVLAQDPVIAGYRDLYYGSTNDGPTQSKPESKLWWTDKTWWGVLYSDRTRVNDIYRLDPNTHGWVDTGTLVDERPLTKADVLWDDTANKLYIASHRFAEDGHTVATPADWGRLYRYSYNSSTKTFSLDSGFPVAVNRARSEILVLAKDSTGTLWVTWVENSQVMVNHSNGNDTTWDTPYVLPVTASAVNVMSDDISTIVAFGGQYVGIMWSNQNTQQMYFSVHRDGDLGTVWQAEETALAPGAACATACADDHINLKADNSGVVYAAAKTSMTNPTDPLIMLLIRETNGTWTSTVFSRVSDDQTRPMIQLDITNSRLYFFATTGGLGGIISYKSAPLSSITFASGSGTPFISSSTDSDINDVTATKQNLSTASGMVLLASDNTDYRYLHNTYSLTSSTQPSITSFSPASGSTGATITINGANLSGVTSVNFGGVPATFTIRNSSQIRATLPAKAKTGKITVGTSSVTAESLTNFVVNDQGPVISGFSPSGGVAGTAVTITGNGFASASIVKFNGISSTFTLLGDVEIHTTVPTGATTGPIYVTTPDGTGTSTTAFVVPGTPTITSFSPASATVGASILITGSSLTGATSVSFGGTAAMSFIVDSDTQIHATVPAGANSGKISVTTPTGTAQSSADFVVLASASIVSFTPTNGPVGTVVTIAGTSLAGTTAVAFNGTPAKNLIIDSDTQVRATVAAGSTSGKISVTNPVGTVYSSADFTITGIAPTVANFLPSRGPVGTEVTVSGTALMATTSVAFNGMAATFTVDSDTQVRAVVPSGATTGKISVTNPTAVAFSVADFQVQTSITATSEADAQVKSTSPATNYATFTTTRVREGTVASPDSYHTYLRFSPGQTTNVSAAKLRLYVTDGTKDTISIYGTDDAWDESSITWNNAPPIGTLYTTVAGATLSTWLEIDLPPAMFNAGKSSYDFVMTSSGTDSGIFSTREGSYPPELVLNMTTSAPTITSFTPASGPTGTVVKIAGSNFTGATAVSFNGVSATSFTADSAIQITATLPAGATTGKVTVVTPGGTATSANDFVVAPAPAITGFAPPSGMEGTSVTITGTNFGGATAVNFNGTPAASITFDSESQLRATVPAGATTGKISVTTPGGTASSGADFLVIRVPAITSFFPASGPAGTSVTIGGTGFSAASAVKFNGLNAASFTINSDTQIKAVVPSGATTGTITVANTAGTGASSTAFQVVAVPVITSFAPTTGPIGTQVTITGSGFVGATAVAFSGTAASFTMDSDTQIRATVPSGTTSGQIRVTNGAGSGFSADIFVVSGIPPTVISFTPTQGPVGTEVTITGSGFLAATSVAFNNTAAAALSIDSDTQLRAVVPTGATTGKISVTNPNATAISTTDFQVVSNVTALPVADAQVKSTGAATNYGTLTSVRLRQGTTSSPGDYRTYIRFSPGIYSNVSTAKLRLFVTDATHDMISVSATDGTWTEAGLTWNNAPPVGNLYTNVSGAVLNAWLEISLPVSIFANGNGTYDFVLTSDGTDSAIFSSREGANPPQLVMEFSAPQARIISFTPTTGPVGTSVVISGLGFTGSTSVTFNSTEATSFSVDSDSQITATVPSGATTGKITIATPGGALESTADFIVAVAPTITSVNPGSGAIGSTVTITGTALNGTTAVKFGTTAATTFTVDSPTQITATVPTGATTGKLAVTTPGGTAESPNEFTVVPGPAITAFNPASGLVGSTVTITGTNLTGTTAVRFNGTESTTFTVDSATQITATVPVGATTGKITIITTGGTATSAADFAVIGTPSISGFAPNGGPVGTSVTISGTALSGATAVKFSGVAARFTAVSDTQVQTTVPSGAVTGKITVSTVGGTATSGSDFVVIPAPTITSFTPTSGPPSTLVTITGANFTGTTSVAFNGMLTSFTVVSATSITAAVPSGATSGTISVATPGGTAVGTAPFTVLAGIPPTVTGFSPSTAPEGTEVTISGSWLTGTLAVSFNGKPATAFTVDSDSQLRVVVPVGATTGKVSITNPYGTGMSTMNFTVVKTITLVTVADAQVKNTSAATNYGPLATIRVRQGNTTSPETYYSYLRFDLASVTTPIVSGKLRLYVTDATRNTLSISGTVNTWTEFGLNWDNAPPIGTLFSTGTAPTLNAWAEIDLPASAFSGATGNYNLVITSDNTDSAIFSSREGTNPPQLVLTVQQ